MARTVRAPSEASTTSTSSPFRRIAKRAANARDLDPVSQDVQEQVDEMARLVHQDTTRPRVASPRTGKEVRGAAAPENARRQFLQLPQEPTRDNTPEGLSDRGVASLPDDEELARVRVRGSANTRRFDVRQRERVLEDHVRAPFQRGTREGGMR